MKKTFYVLAILVTFPTAHATVTWNSSSIFSVTDENIAITGDCYLQNDVTEINAINCDVTVEIKKDAIIYAQENNQYIYVQAIWPYSVTFKVHHDLEFRGVTDQPTEPLQIYVYGSGAIRWEINKDSSLKFNSTKNSGGVLLWHTYYDGSIPVHIFKCSKEDSQIIFGKRCAIGFSVEDECIEDSTLTYFESDDLKGKDNPNIIMHETSSFALELNAVL